MAQIHVLDSETIDKIAAGEVVERPASVVKELVENAIDAGATAITVEAKDGGISFLRITDNGCGIPKEQIRNAFLRHATSKIDTAEDLSRIHSLGFRGEALSSICAVSQVELITKTADALTGVRIILEGAVEKSFDEIGAPDGTTFIMRNLFYNTPVRKKFLKQPATEGSYITDLMEHLALSRPDISFKFVLGNQVRFHTSGNGDLREVIYRIYGRDVASALIPIQCSKDGIQVEGYLGKPVLNRSSRNYEIYYINGRFIKSSVVAKAVEEGYKQYLMQHKFPFCVLHITMDTETVDVNVHPTKMDVRFSDPISFSTFLTDWVRETLSAKEMIPKASLTDDAEGRSVKEAEQEARTLKNKVPEPFEQERSTVYRVMEEANYNAEKPKMQDFMQNPVWNRVLSHEVYLDEEEIASINAEKDGAEDDDFFIEDISVLKPNADDEVSNSFPDEFVEEVLFEEENLAEEKQINQKMESPRQMNLFEEKILTVENKSRYNIIGQLFDTYWMVEFEDKLLMIDQHAAHEKVKYENLMKQFHEKQIISQNLMPPIIVSLTGREEEILKEYEECFLSLGFEIEAFGGNEYALRSVPVDLYGCNEKQMFLEVLDELCENGSRGNYQVVEEKIASMSCKAAVKGNNRLRREEALELIDLLMTLDNPYNCPHGRPTIVTISKAEMEKKFKRIV